MNINFLLFYLIKTKIIENFFLIKIDNLFLSLTNCLTN